MSGINKGQHTIVTLIAGNRESEPELCGAESLGRLPFYPGYVSQDSWGEREDDEVREHMRCINYH